ncbi:hypothetical protein FHN55_20575, partial [Streptomyces sp. NP160]
MGGALGAVVAVHVVVDGMAGVVDGVASEDGSGEPALVARGVLDGGAPSAPALGAGSAGEGAGVLVGEGTLAQSEVPAGGEEAPGDAVAPAAGGAVVG